MVRLRRSVFRLTERAEAGDAESYFQRVLFGNPWVADDLPSLVLESEDGSIVGFLGVIPRPMAWRGENIRAAVATQLMVAPNARGLAGRTLLRAFLQGPQDLSFSDAANTAARRIWTSLGGSTAWSHSLAWSRVLRPARRAVDRLTRGLATSAGRPITSLIELLDVALFRSATPNVAIGSVDPIVVAAQWPTIAGQRALRPRYEDGSLPWLLSMAAEKKQFGALDGGTVWNGGECEGWFVYYLQPGAAAAVAQLAARPDSRARVLSALFAHARARGAVSIEGRASPAWLDDLAPHCIMRRDDPWVLVHSARPDLLRAMEGEEALLSRLDGEWWLSF